MTSSLVSVILPVYNQEDHIEPIVRDYLPVLDALPCDYEVLLVTNACRDRSAEICRNLAEGNSKVRAVDTPRAGWGHAVRTGLAQSRGDLLCYTNSARTSPEILRLTLLYALSYPSVVVKANRKIRDSWRRRLGSLIYNLECRALFDLPTWDINGTPKIFPRSCEKLLKLSRDDDLIDAEFNAVCRREGYPIVEVPVLSTRRHGGKSTTNYGSALRMYWGAIELWRSLN